MESSDHYACWFSIVFPLVFSFIFAMQPVDVLYSIEKLYIASLLSFWLCEGDYFLSLDRLFILLFFVGLFDRLISIWKYIQQIRNGLWVGKEIDDYLFHDWFNADQLLFEFVCSAFLFIIFSLSLPELYVYSIR